MEIDDILDLYAERPIMEEFAAAKQLYEEAQKIVDLYKLTKKPTESTNGSESFCPSTDSPLTDYVPYSAKNLQLR